MGCQNNHRLRCWALQKQRVHFHASVCRSTDERHIILSIRSWQGKSQGHENNISISNGMLCTGGCFIGKQGLMEYPSIDTIR